MQFCLNKSRQKRRVFNKSRSLAYVQNCYAIPQASMFNSLRQYIFTTFYNLTHSKQAKSVFHCRCGN